MTRPASPTSSPITSCTLGLFTSFYPTRRSFTAGAIPTIPACRATRSTSRAAMGLSYDLAELGRHYRMYDRPMGHWASVLPGEFLDVSSEAVVSDQAAQTRRILEYAGCRGRTNVCPFICMSFHLYVLSSSRARRADGKRGTGSPTDLRLLGGAVETVRAPPRAAIVGVWSHRAIGNPRVSAGVAARVAHAQQ